MPTFGIQYTREQRHWFSIEAETEEEAYRIAKERVEKLNLDSPDDESDDDGEYYRTD